MRYDALARLAFLFFSADTQLAAVQSYLDLGGGNARKFDAHVNRVGSLAKIYGRRPRAGDRGQLGLSRFLQDREQAPDPFGQSLKLESLKARRAYALNHNLCFLRRSTRPGADQILKLVHELRNIRELEIYRRKTHVRDFIELFQTSHNQFTNLGRGTLALR